MLFVFLPAVSKKFPLHQNFLPLYLYFKLPNLSHIIMLLLTYKTHKVLYTSLASIPINIELDPSRLLFLLNLLFFNYIILLILLLFPIFYFHKILTFCISTQILCGTYNSILCVINSMYDLNSKKPPVFCVLVNHKFILTRRYFFICFSSLKLN